MNKFTFQMRSFIAIFCCVLAIMLSFKPVSQTVSIVLHNEQAAINPTEFYLADIIDERTDTNPFASILLPANKRNNRQITTTANLQGGAFLAIKQFMLQSMSANKLLRPIIIGIKKIACVESVLDGSRVEGRITFAVAYYLDKGEGEKTELVSYNTSAVYRRTAGPPQQIEPILRKVLQNGLIYINNWMNQQAGGNIMLAKGVKLDFVSFDEQPEGDTLYYNTRRPLTWADFKSGVPNSKYDAEVSPSIGYNERTLIKTSIINIVINIKVCMPKSACWVREGSKTAYTLNHEQRHFDIAAITAERFKIILANEQLPVGNYDGPINVDYLDAYRDMNKLEKQYDDETRHGRDETAQNKWNKKIDSDLKSFGLK